MSSKSSWLARFFSVAPLPNKVMLPVIAAALILSLAATPSWGAAQQRLSVSASLPSGTVGHAYNATVHATGGSSPYLFTVRSGSLPPGLALDKNTGVISGTPSQAGQYAFAIAASDATGRHGDKNLSLHVNPAAISVSITPTGASVASRGSVQFTAYVSGTSNTAVVWSTTSGTVSASGLFTAPSVTVASSAIVTATSVADPSKLASATVSISPASSGGPKITTTGIPSATTGVAYSASLQATGGSLPYTWTVASGSLPGGLQLNSTTGAISGTTVHAGSFSFVAKVIDAAAASDTQSLTLIVSSGGSGPPNYPGSVVNNNQIFPAGGVISVPPQVGPNHCAAGQLTSCNNSVGVNTATSDPDLGNKITRVTDANTFGGTSAFTADAGGNNIWSADASMLIVKNPNMRKMVLLFDPVSQKVAAQFSLNAYGNYWSRQNPGVLYTQVGTVIRKLVVNGSGIASSSVVYDYASPNCLGTGFVSGWAGVFHPSFDETVFTMAYAQRGDPTVPSSTGNWLVSYNTAYGNSGCDVVKTNTGDVWHLGTYIGKLNTPDLMYMHEGGNTPNAQIAAFEGGVCVNSGCFLGAHWWTIGTLNVVPCGPSKAYGGAINTCTGHSQDGFNNWLDGTTNKWWIRSYANPTGTYSGAGIYHGTRPNYNGSCDQHTSWLTNIDGSDTAQFIASTACTYPPLTTFDAAWENEIIGFSMDGTKAWRFTHNYISGQAPGFDATNGMAQISPDGRCIAFSSDWLGTLGPQGTPVSGQASCSLNSSCRSDVFVVCPQ
ncbi:MAG TPA: putative Ig domain-containing protein [Terriglobales bacterium]